MRTIFRTFFVEDDAEEGGGGGGASETKRTGTNLNDTSGTVGFDKPGGKRLLMLLMVCVVGDRVVQVAYNTDSKSTQMF